MKPKLFHPTSFVLCLTFCLPAFLLFCLIILPSCLKVEEKPNIILIMGDDIGYSDIGCYGSEIRTPVLDQLAQDGMKFRNFYNMAKCETSRTTLLTGLYWGSVKAVNLARILKSGGYTTIHSGKEHFISKIPESVHASNNFDNSFTFWANNEYFIPPDSSFSRPFFLNGRLISENELANEFPGFYKTDVVTDYALRFLEEAKKQDNPFFLYLPYNAAHYPLQANPEDIEKYKGIYNAGWEHIRQERFVRMHLLGIIDNRYSLSEPTDNINKSRGHPNGDDERRSKIPLYRPWDSLNIEEKEELALEMNVFAAIVDRMDQNIGRIVHWLNENDEYDNTIIMYLSDNGSCPYDSNKDFDHPPGPADSYRTLSAAWANVGNTPFRYFKQFGHAGGCNTHFIVHWPEHIKPGETVSQQGHIVDIYPTLLEITGIDYPDSLDMLHGSSLLPVFKGQERKEPEFFISGFQERFRMFRQGEWKIVRANKGPWELYNLTVDPCEVNDLSDSLPDKTMKLVEYYTDKKESLNQ